jgi:hypothetical protein
MSHNLFKSLKEFAVGKKTGKYYSLPALEPELVDEIIANPYETTSDSYYFVGQRLVMHNKAAYRYSDARGASHAKEMKAAADAATGKRAAPAAGGAASRTMRRSA